MRLSAMILAVSLAASALAQPYNPVVLWDRSGAGDHSRYGIVYSLGDQNDDGFADFAVWALGWGDPGQASESVIEFFHGGRPPDSIPYMTFRRLSPMDHGIAYFEVVGDLNGDGFKDWEIAYRPDGDATHYVTELHWGGPMADTLPDLGFYDSTNVGYMPIGDFNGDGFDDLYRYTEPPLDFGDVLYGGNPMDTIADWTMHSPAGHPFQALPNSSGDINGDGAFDFISHSPNERITYIFLGGTNPDTIPAYMWENFYHGTLEIISDLNADGYDELVFSESGGQFSVHLGGETLSAAPDFTLNFDPACYPFLICSLGDMNHDGYKDLAVVDDFCNNGWGTLSLYLGYNWLNPDPVVTIEGREPPLNLVGINNATGLGDVDGDGISDFAIGAFNSNTDGFRGRVVVLSGDTTLRVGADDSRPELPRDLSVTVYPNPFNAKATISLNCPIYSQEVKLTVYNLLGQEVRQTTLRNVLGAIRYHFDATGLSSGLYVLRVQAGSLANTQKLVLMR